MRSIQDILEQYSMVGVTSLVKQIKDMGKTYLSLIYILSDIFSNVSLLWWYSVEGKGRCGNHCRFRGCIVNFIICETVEIQMMKQGYRFLKIVKIGICQQRLPMDHFLHILLQTITCLQKQECVLMRRICPFLTSFLKIN